MKLIGPRSRWLQSRLLPSGSRLHTLSEHENFFSFSFFSSLWYWPGKNILDLLSPGPVLRKVTFQTAGFVIKDSDLSKRLEIPWSSLWPTSLLFPITTVTTVLWKAFLPSSTLMARTSCAFLPFSIHNCYVPRHKYLSKSWYTCTPMLSWLCRSDLSLFTQRSHQQHTSLQGT